MQSLKHLMTFLGVTSRTGARLRSESLRILSTVHRDGSLSTLRSQPFGAVVSMSYAEVCRLHAAYRGMSIDCSTGALQNISCIGAMGAGR